MSGNSWGAKHKQALAIAGAAAATAMTMGAASPALAAALGGTAAAEGGAGLGAGLLGGAADAATAAGSAGALGSAGGIGTTAMGAADALTAATAPTAQTDAALALGDANPLISFNAPAMFGSPATTSFGTGGGPLGTTPMGANAAFGQATAVNPGMAGAQASMPALGDPLTNYQPGLLNQIRGGFTNLVGGPDNKDAILKGLDRFNKAGTALQKSGLLGGQQSKPPPPPSPESFGRAAPAGNLTQFLNQPNSMMGGFQLPIELQGLPPNDPRVQEYLRSRRMQASGYH